MPNSERDKVRSRDHRERWLRSALAVTPVQRRLAAQLISRADKRRDPIRFEAQLLPQPDPSLSKNTLDGASAAYLQVDPLNGLFVYVIQRQRSYGFIWCQALTIVSRHERRRNRAQAVSPRKMEGFWSKSD